MATSLGNLSGHLSLGIQIADVPATLDKFGTVMCVIVNNTWGVAQSDGRTARFTTTAAVTADANLSAAEKADINKLLGDLGSGKQVLVGAQLTADAGSFTTTLDAIRDLDDDWYGFQPAGFNTDASLQSIAAWAETTDSDERGGKKFRCSHSAAGVGAGAYAGGSADVSAAVATNAYERTSVVWTNDTATYTNQLAASAANGSIYKHDFDQSAASKAWARMSTIRDTFTATQEANALTYTGTSLIGDAHGAGGGTNGQLFPNRVGQGSADETIIAADWFWTKATDDLAVALADSADAGRRDFPFDESGNNAVAGVLEKRILDGQRIGWIGASSGPDRAGNNDRRSRVVMTAFASLSAAAVAAQRFEATVYLFTAPGMRALTGTIYVAQ